MEVVYRWNCDPMMSEDEVIDELRDTVDDYMDSHPRLRVDISDWNFQEILHRLICDDL